MWYLKLFKRLKPFNNIHCQYMKTVHKLKMNNAYFRYVDGEDQFDMFIKLKNEKLGVDRQFNFRRQLAEPVNVFLGRVATNIEKIINKKKKKQQQNVSNININILSISGENMDQNLSCKELFLNNLNLLLKIEDTILSIKVNTPWIDKITLPTSIMCNFPVYPNKLEGYFFDQDKCLFTWFKKLPNEKEWKKIAEGFYYLPTVEDISHHLKLICKPQNEIECGPDVEVESKTTIEAGPGLCPFEKRHSFTNEKLCENKFRIVSYNILADLYCDSDFSRESLYPYCPPYALSIDYRKQLLLKELVGYNSDIICLQEVDEKIFNSSLTPVLSRLHYKGLFYKKGGQVTEGLCCFYDTRRFTCLLSEGIILGEELSINPIFSELLKQIELNKQFCDRIFPRTTALQINVLKSLNCSNEIIVIGNTHLYFHPDADHVRLFQAGLAIKYLQYIINDIQEKNPNTRISLMFCGDFNSVPECGIYKLMTTGSVDENCIDWMSNSEQAVKDVSLSQPFNLESACGTPKYTNFTAGFADCLDYIFYQKNYLNVVQVIPFPSDDELQAHTALPSIVFPSDHIALIADLEWIK